MIKSQGDINFAWTSIFFDSLQQIGVKHIVISPGSRSTPLTLAAAHNNDFEKHVILDERSAAFTALGIGKATNTPAVLISTSGTAVANFYPAVIEARQSGIPLILATADRPPNLRATGANQAIDQLKIFGDYPVFFHEVGEPKTESNDIQRLQLLSRQAVSKSRNERGPVHLNFAFRKPLEPETKDLDKLTEEARQLVPPVSKYPMQEEVQICLSDQLNTKISKTEKPLLVIGSLAPGDKINSAIKLAEQLNAPIVSESTIAHKNGIGHFAGFLRNQSLRDQLEPDLILRFGFQPTTKSLENSLKEWNPGMHLHFASTRQWQDATFSHATRIEWNGQPIKFDKITQKAANTWLERWEKAEHEFKNYYQTVFDKQHTLTDGAIYNSLTPQIPDGSFLMISNSFPARDIHLFGKQNPNTELFQNRGASGIDGVTSTSLGISLATQKPGILITGDLAFLHDTNALLNQNKIEHPLTIIVINNNGGSIFRMLPIAKNEEYFNSYFETPQSVTIEKLVGSYDIPYHKISSLSDLQNFNLSDWINEHQGLSVVECQTDPEASMNLREQLWNF